MFTKGQISRYKATASAVILACGITFGAACPAAAATPTGEIAAVRSDAPVLADSWEFHGVFPDPITCHLAGIASGYPYTCNFIFVGWTLWLLVP